MTTVTKQIFIKGSNQKAAADSVNLLDDAKEILTRIDPVKEIHIHNSKYKLTLRKMK